MNALQNPLFRQSQRLALLATLAALSMAAALPAMAMPGGPGPDHGGFGLSMLGGPGRIDGMLDSVNASPDQRAQIKQIVQAAASDMKAQSESGRALHEQALQLFTQPTVDARAAEVLRQQMLTQHDQVSKRALQAMLDLSRVLSPEQRKQLADKMSQRQAMTQRHHAEREGLDKSAK